ncbi:hypothetical protein DFH28DRAFT_1154331 [Melampsora americana]|nr:hypothetical protein DFH28DRAFT_1154331 [Melampsora americana]
MTSRIPSLNRHLVMRVEEASAVLSTELISSQSDSITSMDCDTGMTFNSTNQESKNFEENEIIDPSTTSFDSFGYRLTYHPACPVLISDQALEENDRQVPSDIPTFASSYTFEHTHNVDPLSESCGPPLSAPRTTIDWKRNSFNLVDSTFTDIIYQDSRFNTSMRSKGEVRSSQGFEPSKAQHTVSAHEIETSSWTSTRDSESDYHGCENSDSGSIDDKLNEIEGGSKAVTNKAVVSFSSDKVPQEAIQVSKSICKFSCTYNDMGMSTGEEGHEGEPGSLRDQLIKMPIRSSSIEALGSRLPNVILEISPTLVIYDSRWNRPESARIRLSVQIPLSDQKLDEFVKRVNLLNRSKYKE